MQEPLVVGTTPDERDEGGDPLWWILLVTGSLWVIFALVVFQFDYTDDDDDVRQAAVQAIARLVA